MDRSAGAGALLLTSCGAGWEDGETSGFGFNWNYFSPMANVAVQGAQRRCLIPGTYTGCVRMSRAAVNDLWALLNVSSSLVEQEKCLWEEDPWCMSAQVYPCCCR